MRFPDFYCIGVQKAGTTWLHRQLSLHPEIWLMPNALKEIQYFNEIYIKEHESWTQNHRIQGIVNLIKNELANGVETNFEFIKRLSEMAFLPRNDIWYSSIFDSVSKNIKVGDITPEYSLLPEKGIRHLFGLNRDVKLILLLRHPVERDFSHIKMILKNKYGKNLDLMTEKELLQHMISAADHDGVASRSDYKTVEGLFTEVIPSANYGVFLYDEIAENPIKLLTNVCEFLELEESDEVFRDAEKASFVGPKFDMPEELREKLMRRHRDTVFYVNDKYDANWVTD